MDGQPGTKKGHTRSLIAWVHGHLESDLINPTIDVVRELSRRWSSSTSCRTGAHELNTGCFVTMRVLQLIDFSFSPGRALEFIRLFFFLTELEDAM